MWDAKTKRRHGLNASGRSPKPLTLEHFRKLGLTHIPAHGPLPVSVPGCVDGWFERHGRFGRLPMTEVLAPAIGCAREGFPASVLVADSWDRSVPVLGKYPGSRETFTVDGKRAPRSGEVFRNPRLAATQEAVARGGRDAFYPGGIARTIAAYLKAQGGFLSDEDLASHHSGRVQPLSVNYRGCDVWELPPNDQGLAALQMLNLLEGHDVSRIPFGSPRHVHLFTEAKKLVFEDRAKVYADPAFAKVPVAWLFPKEEAAQRRALIDGTRASRRREPGHPPLKAGDTVCLTPAEAEGDLGFCLQDRGELFALEGGQAAGYERYLAGSSPQTSGSS